MKKFLIIAIASFSFLAMHSEAHADNVSIKINDSLRSYDQSPIMKDNRVFIPIRGISEDTGANVLYKNADKKVTIQKDGTTIEFVIGSTKAVVNNQEIEIPESFLANNRTMLPLRFINEMMGFRVDWNQVENMVSITTGRQLIVDKIKSNTDKYLGIPYLYGGTFEKNGKFDCSSFTQKVFAESGVQLPRISGEQSLLGKPVDLASAKPGDLVFFDINGQGRVSHVAIFIDKNTLLQSTTSLGVSYTSFSKYWLDRLYSVRDIIQLD